MSHWRKKDQKKASERMENITNSSSPFKQKYLSWKKAVFIPLICFRGTERNYICNTIILQSQSEKVMMIEVKMKK